MLAKIRNILGRKPAKIEHSLENVPEVKHFRNETVEQAGKRIRSPDSLKKDINHNGHFRVIARNDEEAESIGKENLKSSSEKKTVLYGDDNISGYISGDRYLKFLTLTRNGDIFSTYPLFSAGKPTPARLTNITECENSYEGQLEIFLNGSAISFFDTLYFANKNKYYPGKDVKVLLSGVAYVLTRARKAPLAEKKSQAVPKVLGEMELATRYENGDLDDYIFRGIVKGVKEFRIREKKAYVIKTSLKTGIDGDHTDFYICATENAIQEKVRVGDHISGIVWMQGFIVE
ncbi:hypothetical protein CUJ83_07050 [Methanocella sp. CWC-04]|uniref:Uncharacterized protein n=1 Tax=Methanooceanicella nereidis TaxID=2052831 RepID=A0AAP2RDR7_9EURY|nr:hypothetical protein [Methanocella sp. CWC-04]MCD1294755.1 hypothetical protein [Methanocella sp. CWC-04]